MALLKVKVCIPEAVRHDSVVTSGLTVFTLVLHRISNRNLTISTVQHILGVNEMRAVGRSSDAVAVALRRH